MNDRSTVPGLSRVVLRSLVLGLAGASAVVAACQSSDTLPSGTLPPYQLDPNEGGSSDANSGFVGDASDAGPTDAGADAFDAASVARDRFRHTWPVTANEPATASYTIDTDVVTDKVTGLQWTRGVLKSQETTFDGGFPPDEISTASQSEARGACAAATVGGLTGWRLPTLVELMTVISFESDHWNNATAFRDTGYGTRYFVDSNTADLFLRYDNQTHPWTFRTATLGLATFRCVRSPYPVKTAPEDPPAGRYLVKTGTVVDNVTRLEWQTTTSPALQFYADATTYCANLSSSDAGVPAGGGTWRIPSLKELATIWSESAGGLEPTVFGPVLGSSYVWTSTLYWGTQSIPYANKNIRFSWRPGGTKIFAWDADPTFSFTKCVRDVP